MGGKGRAEPGWLGLADEWRHWVAEALRNGADRETVGRALAARGVPTDVAAREIDIIAVATAPLRQRAARLEHLLRLLRELEGSDIDTLANCDSEVFYARYFRGNRPVLFTDPWRGQAPLAAWSFAALRDRHGHVEVSVARGRNRSMSVVVDPREHSEMMPLAAVIDAAIDEPELDLYIVSRNLALEGPLAALCAELVDLPTPLEKSPRHRVSLWLGPAGTRTPFHHDTTNVFFSQMVGRKRVRLVSSRNVDVLCGPIESSFYTRSDIDAMGNDTIVADVILEPGQALFIPVGWWHEIEALDPSLSLSFTNLALPNRFEWYRPGDV